MAMTTPRGSQKSSEGEPVRYTHSKSFSYFVTATAAPVASGWSGCRVGLAPTGKRRLATAHTQNGHFAIPSDTRCAVANNAAAAGR